MCDKYLLFEYLVFRLNGWRSQLDNVNIVSFSKLRLQKILFLVCAYEATNDDRKLLNVFDNFFALPYGPVELDIYEAMNEKHSFKHMYFEGNNCVCNDMTDSLFEEIPNDERSWVDEAINAFRNENKKYLTMPVFDLVEITHKWTVWQVSMDIAKFLGSKKGIMHSEDICDSPVKFF